jgi:hypothetical protein
MADETLISQGDVSVSYQDIDGFTYFKIPEDKRNGFYKSVKRIDQTIMTLLTMKHMVKYAIDNNLVDQNVVDNNVAIKVVTTFADQTVNKTMQEEMIYQSVLDYIKLDETYKLIKSNIIESITDSDVMDLADEEYLLNKDYYFKDETRDITILNFMYNEDNKEEKFKTVQMFLKEIKSSKNQETTISNYKKNLDIEVINDFKDYSFDKKYEKFSEFVFSTKQTQVINDIFDGEDKFVIVIINEISEARELDFEEVKSNIIARLKDVRAKNIFSNRLLKITQDSPIINEENIIKLKTRY